MSIARKSSGQLTALSALFYALRTGQDEARPYRASRLEGDELANPRSSKGSFGGLR